MTQLSILIPTLNEEKHIERAVTSALRLTKNVFIIDSFSTDRTIKIAETLGAKVYQYTWTKESNWAKKFNWALANIPFPTEWIMRLDADEYLTDTLIDQVKNELPSVDENINAICINRREYFMRRWIRHGGIYPKIMARITRKGKAFYELRILDEHIEVEDGKSIYWNVDVCDDKITSLTKWISSHNNYAIQESIVLIDSEIGLFDGDLNDSKLDKHAQRKRKNKGFYARLPYFWRAWGFFVYRYILKLGFLDGLEGFLYCFLQCLWYRSIADAKVIEAYRACGRNPELLKEYFLKEYNIDCLKTKK